MNDPELMGFIRNAAKAANEHFYGCGPGCPDVRDKRTYAMGEPPAGWWSKAVQFARKHGQTLIHSWVPRQEGGYGCDGATTGPVGAPPGYTCCNMIAPDLGPATEFAVTAHELTHTLLQHSPRNEREAEQEMRRMEITEMYTGTRESFEQETAAHLAAIGASKAAGLRIAQPSLCYLAQHIRRHRRKITDNEVQAAFYAARAIRDGVLR